MPFVLLHCSRTRERGNRRRILALDRAQISAARGHELAFRHWTAVLPCTSSNIFSRCRRGEGGERCTPREAETLNPQLVWMGTSSQREARADLAVSGDTPSSNGRCICTRKEGRVLKTGFGFEQIFGPRLKMVSWRISVEEIRRWQWAISAGGTMTAKQEDSAW